MNLSAEVILKAIQHVCQGYEKHLLTSVEGEDIHARDLSLSTNEIIFSISCVSEVFNNLPPQIDDSIKDDIRYNDLMAGIKGVSSLISQKKDLFKIDINSSIPLLNFLGREWDENFHSDYIAQILQPSRMGTYANLLMEKVISKFITEASSLNSFHIKVEREKLLADFDAPKEIEKRRIDLFISVGKFLVIIENKINSYELEDQTKDYYNSVANYYSSDIAKGKKKIIAILLSPSKLVARDPHFISMSYIELTRIMLATSQDGLSESMKTFLNLYLRSIYYNFVEKQTTYENQLQEFWRKAG